MLNGLQGPQIFRRWISTFGAMYLKERVYRDNPKTITKLKEAIATEIRSIGPGVNSAVMNSMKKRAQICIQSGGRHMKNIILKNLPEKIPMCQDSNATLFLKIG